VEGTRVGDISFTAPFRYVIVPLAFVIGWAVWGRVPDLPMVLGTAVIVGAGLLALRGERPVRPRRRRRPGAPHARDGSGRPAGNRRAATLVVVAVVTFAVNDALVKLLTARLPPGEVMALRGLFVTALLFLLLPHLGLRPGRPDRFALLRSAASSASTPPS
jgi:drug/metabolite transporter (DMT)-like permease